VQKHDERAVALLHVVKSDAVDFDEAMARFGHVEA
jgi:hypothetical protein